MFNLFGTLINIKLCDSPYLTEPLLIINPFDKYWVELVMTNESNSLDQIITKFDSQKKKKNY